MILNYNFFEPDEILEPQKGRVLISEPFLLDNYFKRSIVLITEHNDEGTVGFVLNKPIDIPATEILDNFPATNADISLGGPVNTNTLHYIHTLGDIIPHSNKVIGNIYWGGDFDVIERLISSGNLQPGQIKFFLGYSGWSPNQLEDELEESAWLVTELSTEEIMAPMNRQYWKRKLGRMGNKYRMWANFPEDPEMN
ncbi:MAG: YqgE/AlgH family protein [Bacteroidales bacterium]|nr:YqgE/AlgH family protein [Bacteroidales bacterium]MBN2818478.1 YqgE/AlgH family protein [Bacteroidales bacterium]